MQLVGDAMEVELQEAPDIVLTETMNQALYAEPQVQISRALMRQFPDAMLLPQEIRVELALVNSQAELSQFPLAVGERHHVEHGGAELALEPVEGRRRWRGIDGFGWLPVDPVA